MNTFVHTPYTVNGHFLCRNLTGIERFSIEVLKEMDKIVPQGFLSLLIPANSPFLPDFKNIQIIQSSKNLTSVFAGCTLTSTAEKGRFIKITHGGNLPTIIEFL